MGEKFILLLVEQGHFVASFLSYCFVHFLSRSLNSSKFNVLQEEHERPRIYRDVLCRIDCKVRTINDDLTGIKFYSYVLLSWIYTVISHAVHLSYQLEFFEYLGRNLQNFHWLLQVAKTKERWADHTEFLYFLFCSFIFLWIPICFFFPRKSTP